MKVLPMQDRADTTMETVLMEDTSESDNVMMNRGQ